MHSRLLSWVVYAALCGLGCCTELPPDADVDSGPGRPQLVEPELSLLCELEVGETSDSEVEEILGTTDPRETADSTTLLYQYATGFTLSLLFRDDVFESATVYNGTYPACWAEDERSRSARVATTYDGGVEN
jgi:hypothetical protein